MFDDPKKELKRLEEELLKGDDRDAEFERFYQEILDEFGTAEDDEIPAAPVRKVKASYADAPRAVAPVRKKSNRGLVILLLLELAGIGAIAAWWLQRLVW